MYFRRKGKEYKEGRWRFPQDIVIDEAESSAKVRSNEIGRKIETAVRDVRDGNSRSATSRQYLQGLRDPAAIPKLQEAMENDARSKGADNFSFRAEIIAVLRQIDHPASAQAMIERVLSDPSLSIADECIEILGDFYTEMAVAAMTARLANNTPHKDDPLVINRAARALASIGDQRCIPRLIDCLVTRHIRDPGNQPGLGVQATAPDPGGMNFSQGKKKAVELRIPNAEVLAALQGISGESGFQYDKDAWLKWYADKFAPEQPYVLRDP